MIASRAQVESPLWWRRARRPRRPLALALLALASILNGCNRSASGLPEDEPHRLPTGAVLDPAGSSIPLGSMPVAMTFAPGADRIVVVLSGYRDQGVQVVDRGSHRVLQTLVQPSAFLGAAFSPDGKALFVSGGNRDLVYKYAWSAGAATLSDSIALGPRPGPDGGHSYPAGLACSPDGSRLYVVENLRDSLAVIDLASGRVTQRLETGRYPFGVVVRPDGGVYVSAWGGTWVTRFSPGANGLVPGPRIPVGRHPSTMLLDPAGARLYVTCASTNRIAVVDTRGDSVVSVMDDHAPEGPSEGSTPNGLALSPDGSRLYVAEADNNAVAVFTVGENPGAVGASRLLGRIPVEWYPTAVLADGDSLWVLNGKGRGTAPNPERGHPGHRKNRDPMQYTLGQTSGTLTLLARPGEDELAGLSGRVAAANGWQGGRPEPRGTLPPFEHVIYIIRENRTFDQVFGDLAGCDADTSLVFFPRAITPNAHALAERFGVYDRFFVNAEVSGDGHNWTTAAYASDYVEKTVASVYSDRGRTYDYQGENRDKTPEDDVNEPANGYLWDAAKRKGITLRNYGEFTRKSPDGSWIGLKPFLAECTDPKYPGWDLDVPDTVRVARWIEEFQGQIASRSMPALSILWLPNDHTAGGRGGAPTPRAYAADNDLALGRVIEALSHSEYWSNTIVFVLEDDAQDGPDHVDSHRSPLLVISAYNRPGVVHRFANTTDVFATMGRILGLGALSNFDHFARPLTEVFAKTPDPSPYAALRPAVGWGEKNPAGTSDAALSRGLDLAMVDRANEALFNRILWQMIKGPERPYPGSASDPRALLDMGIEIRTP